MYIYIYIEITCVRYNTIQQVYDTIHTMPGSGEVQDKQAIEQQ